MVLGSAFGLDPYFRISYATSAKALDDASNSIIDFCEKLD